MILSGRQLPNSLLKKPQRVSNFAVSLAAAARIFTLQQIAKHPDISGLSQPQKKASAIISACDFFERLNGPRNESSRWRLTKQAKRDLNIHQKSITGVSNHAEHWLGIGDIWMSITFAKGRPTEWHVDPYHQFDIYCVWQNKPYLIEYQRTPITTREWRRKWDARLAWFKSQAWNVKPIVVLVTEHHQEPDTMCIPKGTIHAKSIDELPRILNKT